MYHNVYPGTVTCVAAAAAPALLSTLLALAGAHSALCIVILVSVRAFILIAEGIIDVPASSNHACGHENISTVTVQNPAPKY